MRENKNIKSSSSNQDKIQQFLPINGKEDVASPFPTVGTVCPETFQAFVM
jgi:hypothetical protein